MQSSILHQILHLFEAQSRPMSLTQMAAALQVEPSALEGMINHWVRKGKLREINLNDTQGCTSCGTQDSCPFVVTMPRTYELVRKGDISNTVCKTGDPVCGCKS